MTSCQVSRARLVLPIASLCVALMGSARAAAQDVGTEAQRESGKRLYLKYCSQCHGEKGDGEGYAAPHLRPRPRNFTTGKFKVRTTPNGALPTHQDLVNVIRRGMPYTSMPAWPSLSDQEVTESRVLPHDVLPRLLEQGKRPPARAAPECAERHERVHRAREEALRRDRMRKVPRYARSRRRNFGANPDRRLGSSDTACGSRSELDVSGRRVARGHLQDDEHGAQRHADAVVRRLPHARAAMGHHGFHRLSLGEQRARLYEPRHRQARSGSHRSCQGGGELCLRSCGPLSDRRADHGADTLVPSARDERQRSGDLRCGLHRPAGSVARHERGESRAERAVASRASGGGGGSGARRCPEGRREPFWRGGGGAGRCSTGRSESLCRGGGGTGRPAVRVLRRGLDSDSFAGADGCPQALFHLRRCPELGGSLVLRSGPPRSAAVHR